MLTQRFESVIDTDNGHIINVFGHYDFNIKLIEKAFNVTIVNRDNNVKIMGTKRDAEKAGKVISSLIELSLKKEEITEQKVNYVIQSAVDEDKEFNNISDIYDDHVCTAFNGKKIAPRTLGQKKYVDMIKNDTVIFCVGPAGTGKTYLAMAMAVKAFKNNEVQRIILTRPAIEAGEKLGFLPGDLQQKVDPYLRPLYDALHEIMGTDAFVKNMEKGAIEVAPLAYMRGRTLDNCFIVLDEAQNTTPPQMKMFLTRIGFGSKAVITGDSTQVDLPDKTKSGLVEATKILDGIDKIGISYLTNKDVVRHPLVQKIVLAYEQHEKRRSKRRN